MCSITIAGSSATGLHECLELVIQYIPGAFIASLFHITKEGTAGQVMLDEIMNMRAVKCKTSTWPYTRTSVSEWQP